MQTQTQMEIQASSHVQRKRKEREIRKRSRSFSKMADNDWAFAVSHVWEANANTNWKMFYHTIYFVIQGFPALRKALTTHVKKKMRYFFTCVWYRQSAADTLHAFRATRSGWRKNNKASTILNPKSFVGLFSNYGC